MDDGSNQRRGWFSCSFFVCLNFAFAGCKALFCVSGRARSAWISLATESSQSEFLLFLLSFVNACLKSKHLLAEEIVPVNGVKEDEGPRETTLEGLQKLKPAFGGLSTAGNSSQVSDGCAAVLMMNAETAAKLNFQVLGRLLSYDSVGVDPKVMGIGPAVAIPRALKKANLTVNDIDVWEINEAFASQYGYTIRVLGIDPNKVNVQGGAISLGHPLGNQRNKKASSVFGDAIFRSKRSANDDFCSFAAQSKPESKVCCRRHVCWRRFWKRGRFQERIKIDGFSIRGNFFDEMDGDVLCVEDEEHDFYDDDDEINNSDDSADAFQEISKRDLEDDGTLPSSRKLWKNSDDAPSRHIFWNVWGSLSTAQKKESDLAHLSNFDAPDLVAFQKQRCLEVELKRKLRRQEKTGKTFFVLFFLTRSNRDWQQPMARMTLETGIRLEDATIEEFFQVLFWW